MVWSNRYRVAGRVNFSSHNPEPLSAARAREQKELRAMASVNLVILMGNLGKDPELKYTQNGKAFCNFSIATSESWTDAQGNKQEKTEWHRITVWGKLAENCKRYLAKGSAVYIEGSVSTRTWDDNDGNKQSTTEVRADKVNFLSHRREIDERVPGYEQHGSTG